MHIFISYARSDGQEYAEKLDHDLRLAGYTTWRDVRSIDEYQDFSAEIELAIRDAAFVVVVVSPSIEQNARSFVRREIIYAENCQKPIIPLVFPNANVPILLTHLTWIRFTRGDKPNQILDYADGLRSLLQRLQEPVELVRTREIIDPFREYLKALYDQILYYLNQTVFTYIPLRGQSSQDAVDGDGDSRRSVLPMAFLSMAGIADEEADQQFNSFHQAAEVYQGRLLVMGEPGAGKTITLFAYARDAVARRLEDPTQPLPIIAPVATWDAQKRPGLIPWLAAILPVFKRDELARLADYGQLLLLLDGLDELGGEREEKREDGTVERYDPRWRFIQMLPENNQVMVTCRIKDYEELVARHGKKIRLNGAITLQPLDDAQIEGYLHELPVLREAIQHDDELREAARTPLLLSLLTFAYRESADLPQLREFRLSQSPGDLRDKIFELFVRRSYEREARKPHTAPPFSLAQIHQILGQVAVRNALHRHGMENVITPGNLKAVLPAEKIAPFLTLMNDLHLFVPIDERFYRFVHLLLRDYFLYRYAVDQKGDGDIETRRRAVEALGRLGRRAFEALVEALHDPDADVRVIAAQALGRLEDARAVEGLMAAYPDVDRVVRTSQIEALSAYKDSRLFDLFLEALKDANAQTRVAAAEALGELRDERAVAALSACLQDENSYVRSFSVKALGKFRDIRLIDTIIPVLQDENQFVRSAASMALCEIRDTRAVPPILPLLRDPDRRTRRVVVYVLGLFRDAQAIPALIEALDDEDHQVRKKSLLALKMIGTPAAMAVVRQHEGEG